MKNPIDNKLYMNQMKRDLQMQKVNKEKEMQKEIMILKKENEDLKEEIRQFADWFWLLARKLKEANQRIDQYEKHFKPVIVK